MLSYSFNFKEAMDCDTESLKQLWISFCIKELVSRTCLYWMYFVLQ